jgi:formylglycine-generating enzyme required for sulfatase activity
MLLNSEIKKILPEPFDWCEIPAGDVEIHRYELPNYLGEDSKIFHVSSFEIAKYPITNAQYDVFVKAGGYQNQAWWTEDGWRLISNMQISLPNNYDLDETFLLPEHPRVNIRWYEAVAFCLWLREVSGETIMLPTEAQWQRAAQGDDKRIYPWGNDWDGEKCNNSIPPKKSFHTSAVKHYEDTNVSPYGVVDMVGNVAEWCLTDDETGLNNFRDKADFRVIRGSSWRDDIIYPDFRVDYRFGGCVVDGHDDCGFRVCRVTG